jgi:DNA invertase Pin-like site-specific DNA recombinase
MHIRVAAYCRVSTGDESQQTSYTNQKAFYTGLIQEKKGWKFAGIYTDEAISGTSRMHRDGFNQMMEDARKGSMDYIITKSISRFSRNTVDTLNCVRELRQQNPPVGIYFEKENIDTLDASGELILTILSALAQDESRSISENIRWTFQKKFQVGIPQINLKRMLGYDKAENGSWVIHPAQAEIVRYIFNNYIEGKSANKIACDLNAMNKKTVNGNLWTSGAVLTILRNEKYVGDLEMQKTVTIDFLSHRSVANKGKAPKYYIENHHEGIVDRMTWNKVQAILSGRTKKSSSDIDAKTLPSGTKKSLFSRLQCGEILCETGRMCGEAFFRMTYTGSARGYRDYRSMAVSGGNQSRYLEKYSYAYPVWRCRQRNGGGVIYHECAIEQSFMESLYRIKRDYETYGESSDIYRLFHNACQRISQSDSLNNIKAQQMEVLDGQIQALEAKLQRIMNQQNPWTDEMLRTKTGDGGEERTKDFGYMELAAQLQQRLEELYREKERLESEIELAPGELLYMKKNFDFFIECIQHLPEINAAGMSMTVYGLDVSEISKEGGKRENITEIESAPDYLYFDRAIFSAFIVSGVVQGDVIEYRTNFGVRFMTCGNQRTLRDFVGFRRCGLDGTAEILDAPYKIYGNSIQYRRYPRKKRSVGYGEK